MPAPLIAARTGRGRRRAGTLWGNRDFLLLWSGQTLSVLGSRASALAFPLLVLELTQSPVRAGVVGFVAGLPVLCCQLPAGALVDRWNRKSVMIGCDLGRLLVIASIPVLGWLAGISYLQLVLTAFLHATLSVVFALAERAALPHVVDAASLPVAVAQNQARMQGAMMAGPPLGGLLFGISRVLPFVVDAVSYLVSLLTLVLIRTPLQDPPQAHRQRLHREVAEGLRFVWRDRYLRVLSLYSAAITLLATGFPLALIVLARHLGATPGLIGVILGISGAGGLLGALLAPRLVRVIPAGKLNIIGLWIWGVLTALLAVMPSALLLAPGIGGGRPDPPSPPGPPPPAGPSLQCQSGDQRKHRAAGPAPGRVPALLARGTGNLRCAGNRSPAHRSHRHSQPHHAPRRSTYSGRRLTLSSPPAARGTTTSRRAAKAFPTVAQHSGDIPAGTLRAIERDLEIAFGEGWLR